LYRIAHTERLDRSDCRFDVFGKSEELIRRLRRARLRGKGAGVQARSRFALLKRSHRLTFPKCAMNRPNSRSAAEVLAKVDLEPEVVGI